MCAPFLSPYTNTRAGLVLGGQVRMIYVVHIVKNIRRENEGSCDQPVKKILPEKISHQRQAHSSINARTHL